MRKVLISLEETQIVSSEDSSSEEAGYFSGDPYCYILHHRT